MNRPLPPLPHREIVIDDELTLRALRESNAGRLFELTDQNREYLGKYLPWVEKTVSIRDSLKFIQEVIDERLNGEQYGFGIFVNNELQGHISLMHIKDEQTPEIGYWLAESLSGKGITSRAALAVTDFGFNELELEKILIRAREDNIASNKIAEKLGYKFDGLHDEESGHKDKYWIKTNDSKYAFKNESSLGNIPVELLDIVDDTISTYLEILPKDLFVCIFAEGSLVRGNFKPGISDFDTCALIKRPLTDEERDTIKPFKRKLQKKYVKLGVEKVDIDFTQIDDFLSGERPKLNFIFATDGVCMYGEAPEIIQTWPDPGNELSKMLNHGFVKTVGHYKKHLETGDVFAGDFSPERWVAKQGARLLFGMTMKDAKEYVVRMEDYRRYIEQYLPAQLERYDYLYTVYETGEAKPQELLTQSEAVLALAQDSGAA